MKQNMWRLFLPILSLHIEIPFIEIRTEIMNERIEYREREYILLFVRIFKWSFKFELYDTYRREDLRTYWKKQIDE